MTKKKKEEDLTMTEKEIEIGKVTFSFTLTRQEADCVLKKPKGQIARNLRKYMNSILEEACKRFNDSSNVTDCKEKEE